MKERVIKNDENKRNFKKNEEYTIDKLKKIISNSTNSHRRKFLAHQLRSLTRKEQSKKRRERKKIESDGGKVTRQIPNTIESLRVLDETIVEDADEEVVEAERVDEFSDYMNKKVVPKLLITTSENPSIKLKNFIKELLLTIPSSYYYKRGNFRAKSIMKYAINKEFTDVIIIVEHLKKPYGMYISHLPEGPTSFFRLTSLKLSQEMKGSAALTTHLPEVLLNNFTTRLGRRVAKQLMALFPQKPEFLGRRAVCFHNQRDFIFFRQHRYIFCNGGEKCSLQEIGPRFTLKLRWMQAGIIDGKKGLFEFKWKADSQTNRKVLFL